MLSQEKLWNLINSDLCASRNGMPSDEMEKPRKLQKIATLTWHLEWTREAGDDQAILEELISSLEENMIVPYREWRELSTLKHWGQVFRTLPEIVLASGAVRQMSDGVLSAIGVSHAGWAESIL